MKYLNWYIFSGSTMAVREYSGEFLKPLYVWGEVWRSSWPSVRAVAGCGQTTDRKLGKCRRSNSIPLLTFFIWLENNFVVVVQRVCLKIEFSLIQCFVIYSKARHTQKRYKIYVSHAPVVYLFTFSHSQFASVQLRTLKLHEGGINWMCGSERLQTFPTSFSIRIKVDIHSYL